MKYRSQNKTVEKALNKTWVLIGIPFFTTMIGTFIFGFYIIITYDISVNLAPIVVLVLGIVIPSFICHQISKIWFSQQLDKVTDKIEFAERAERNLMIWPTTAAKIFKKKGLQSDERIGKSYEYLPDLEINEVLMLTTENLIIGGQFYVWTDIKDFRITAINYDGFFESVIMLIFLDNHFVRKEIKLTNVQESEYQIDKYLNNRKTK